MSKTITISPVASDINAICETQTPGSATTMTLNGDRVDDGTYFTQPCHVLISCAGDDDLVNFTVVGTDRYGQVLTEVIAGADTGSTDGTKNFSTITSITTSAGCAAGIQVGNTDSLQSQWIPVNRYGGDISIGCTPGDANMTYAIQHTFDDVQAAGFMEDDADTFVHATLTGETTAQDGSYSTPINAFRVSITGYSGSETLTVTYVQERG